MKTVIIDEMKFECEYKRASYNCGDPYPDGWKCHFKTPSGSHDTIFIKYDEVKKEEDLEKRIAYKYQNHMY